MPAIIGLIALLGAVYAIFQVATSDETTPNKTVWILLIIVLPVLGLVVWVVAGPRGRALMVK